MYLLSVKRRLLPNYYLFSGDVLLKGDLVFSYTLCGESVDSLVFTRVSGGVVRKGDMDAIVKCARNAAGVLLEGGGGEVRVWCGGGDVGVWERLGIWVKGIWKRGVRVFFT